MRHAFAFAALAAFAFACGDDPLSPPDAGPPPDLGPPDTGVPDLGPPDTGLPDIGSRDAGAPPDLAVRFNVGNCAPCDQATPCEAGSLCLTAQTGESFCSDRCDDDLEGCPSGFTCLDISGGNGNPAFFCIPPGATCRDGVGYGTPCFEDTSACIPTLDHCQADAFAAGYCTASCASDGDCPSGYACGTGDDGTQVCLSTRLTRAERCAIANGRSACGTHHDCTWQDGERCIRTTPALPGICAPECSPGSCREGTICQRTAEGLRCLPEDCSCHATTVAEGTRDLLAEALAVRGLSRCDTVARLADFAPNPPDLLYDPYRLSFFETAAHEPLRAPEFGRTLVAELDAVAAESTPAPARAAKLVEALAARLDQPVVRRTAGALDGSQPLVRALEAFIQAGGGQPDAAALSQAVGALTANQRTAIARVVEGMTRAAAARNTALPESARFDLHGLGPGFVANNSLGRTLDPANAIIRNLLNQELAYGDLFGGAADLLDALVAANLTGLAGTPTSTAVRNAAPLLNVRTPYGRIIVGGPENDFYDPSLPGLDGEIALLIDLGGNDEYRVDTAGNRSVNHPVAVHVDLGGDDLYAYVEVPNRLDGTRLPSDSAGRYSPRVPPTDDNGPFSFSNVARQGGGRAGTAILWDVGPGRDRYRALRMSQGTGIFGTGVLIDEGGDDVYELEAVGQGAGAFGIGLLIDLGGNDVRRAYHEAQGFGYARGAGLAYDVSGDDEWLMNVGDPEVGGDPLYFSAQRAGRANSSLGQGFGFGRRADFTDRAFFSGGLGLLVDAAGSDRYEASIFAQGGGFWFGTGILADHAGDDEYDALWYAMGTGAHYALGLLLEGGGNDAYGGSFPRVNVTLAGAHDYTTAFLIDDGGDDIYAGSRISLGAGNVNGLGFFVDNAGRDQYDLTRDYGLGGAGNLELDDPGSARRKVKNLGVFVDAGGDDLYTLGGMPFMTRGNNMSWTDSENMDPDVAATEIGVGLDGEGDSSLRARP